MKNLIILIALGLTVFIVNKGTKKTGGKCSGNEYCSACSNCRYCAHCSSGGKCGVCAPPGYYSKKTIKPKENRKQTNTNDVETTSNTPSNASQKTESTEPQKVDTALSNALARQKMNYDQNNKSRPVDYEIVNSVSEEEEVFTVVEEMPEFPGGSMEMQKYINKNLMYPNSAKENGISGTCFVKFIVNGDGSIGDAQVVKGIRDCKECDEEALRLISSMPKWKAGKQNGKPVKTFFNYALKFRIQ